MIFQQRNLIKLFSTGIFGIGNGSIIPLPMGVPAIGTKNWNSQPRRYLFRFSCFFVESFGWGGSCCGCNFMMFALFAELGSGPQPLLRGKRGSCQMYDTKRSRPSFPVVLVGKKPGKYQPIPNRNTTLGYNSSHKGCGWLADRRGSKY